ncbi:hypothetical protein C0991_009817 [Blastosporella zonata]|nr:hypothetical protein C0991_009817 [Blastosporella zonata]
MLVNIVPFVSKTQLAAVVFSVVFEDLDPIPNPSTWAAQLQNLRLDELEVPALVHSLDKAAGIVTLLEEVTFDLSTNTISCHFVDGSMERWPLVGAQCVKALESVVRDVNESLAIERAMELEKQREEELERRLQEAPMPPPTAKPPRHKKQRSLLMTLVASIIPLYSPSSNSRLPTPPPTPISEKIPSDTISPRDRRRRARSDLVDAFRRYALSELSQHFPRGGYTTWIIQSMLRRTTETMSRLVREAGGSTDCDPLFLHHPHESEFFSITAESLPSTPSVSDDEDDGDTFTTDTDGSSLHTPTSPQVQQFVPGYPVKPHNHVSRSPRRLLSESTYLLYEQHAALASRLRTLVAIDTARQEQDADDLQHHHHLLEIRGRRRAWLNKTLHGGVRSQHVDLAMAMVFRSSPLAQQSWSGDDYEYIPDEHMEAVPRWLEYEEYDRMELMVKRERRCTMTSRLFPVSEEEDGEGIDNAAILDVQEVDLDGFDIDLECGVRCDTYDESSEDGGGIQISFEIERPQLRPRVRTSSMYKHRLRVPPPVQMAPERPSTPQLGAASLLCQPLSTVGSSQDDFPQPPEYTEVDVSLNVSQVDISGYGGFDKYAEDEFTLAMDLPISVRVQDRGILANKRRPSFGSDRGWFSSRLSPPPGLGNLLCR